MEIPLAKQVVHEVMLKDMCDVLESGWWTMGKYTQVLEKKFAKYINKDNPPYAVATGSCSSALHLSMLGLKRGTGMVIAPAMTFCSTINAIIHSGLIPVLCDVDRDTGNIDVNTLSLKGIQGAFQAIIPVHFAGRKFSYDVYSFANVYGLTIIEDCAHAVEIDHSDSTADAMCFSFNPIKNLAAPEMGMVVTDNVSLADYISKARLHGMTADAFDRIEQPGQYDISYLGYKYNCTDIEAVIAMHGLAMIEGNWRRRREIVDIYNYHFKKFRNEGLHNSWLIPVDSVDNAFHLYTFYLKNRDDFIIKMKQKGIHCGIHYKPVHLFYYYDLKYNWKKGMFPNAEWIGKHTVSLPLGPGMTDEEVDYVIDSAYEILKEGDYCCE